MCECAVPQRNAGTNSIRHPSEVCERELIRLPLLPAPRCAERRTAPQTHDPFHSRTLGLSESRLQRPLHGGHFSRFFPALRRRRANSRLYPQSFLAATVGRSDGDVRFGCPSRYPFVVSSDLLWRTKSNLDTGEFLRFSILMRRRSSTCRTIVASFSQILVERSRNSLDWLGASPPDPAALPGDVQSLFRQTDFELAL